MSAALPGLGHFYLRRRVLAACELLVGLTLLGAALAALSVTLTAVARREAPPLDLLRACASWALALAAYSAIDGAFTWLVSRHRVVTGPRPRSGR